MNMHDRGIIIRDSYLFMRAIIRVQCNTREEYSIANVFEHFEGWSCFYVLRGEPYLLNPRNVSISSNGRFSDYQNIRGTR